MTQESCPFAPGTGQYYRWWEVRHRNAIAYAVEQLDLRRKLHERIRDNKGYHDFGWERKCACGMKEIEYRAGTIEERSVICALRTNRSGG